MIDESQIEYLLNGERADADTLNRPLRQLVSATNTELTTGLGLKVDKQDGKGLSDRNFTQAEKNKLSSLESSKFVGLFVSESALPTTGDEGDYANVDGGVGADVYRVMWDSSDKKWVRVQGVTGDLTPAQIKQQYESNPDTNAFTNDEKAKLTNVANGATVNRVDSENADKVHTHPWAQVTGKPVQSTRWPTFAEVSDKPTTFTPASHTHPTSQVTGLDTTLAGKADKTTQVIAGTGLSGGGTLAANRTLTVSYGTAAGTAAQGNDARINNGQTAFGWGSHASVGYAKTKADVGLSGIPNTNASTANFLRGDGTWVTPPNTNTTYVEITTAEIDAGTASTLRAISGRRMKHALDKKANTSHTHPVSQVTGLGTAASADLTTSSTDTTAGRVLKVGDFGVGHPTLLPVETDLDTVTTNGSYDVSAAVNRPSGSGGWGYLRVSRHSHADTYCYQEWTDFDSTNPKTYFRARTSGIWGKWVEFHHTGNILQGTGTSTDFPMSQKAVTDQLGTKANTSTQVIAGTGLTGGGNLTANRTLNVSYGTAAGTAAQGNDSRLSNSREWTAAVVSQAEAEAGTVTTARKWTAQRVAQAISAKGLKIGTTASTAKAGNWMPTWANVTGKPTTFTPSAHTHSLSQITDAGSVASLNTNASTANFLRGDGTWVTPPNSNTTYAEISTAEIDAGTAATLRTISGRRMKHALDKKANTGTQVIAGTGLTGGGTLAANRTLNVSYGTAAGTAAQGNDSRLSNSREWTGATISQAEAEAGTATTRRAFTAQRVRQAIVAWFNGNGATTAEVQAGTNTGKWISPASVVQGLSNWNSLISTANTVEAGRGSGSVALTVNDGHGNANVAFNHNAGIPDSNGSSVRIRTDVDGTTASFQVQMANNVSVGVSPAMTTALHLSLDIFTYKGSAIHHAGNILKGTGTSATFPMSQKAVTDALNTKAASSHTHSYLPLAGGTLTGNLSVTGTITATSNITAYSDIKLKENIELIPDALAKINTLHGYTYNRKDIKDSTRHTGVIAQEVQKVLPEAVMEDENGTLSVAYGNMVGLLIEAIKEQSAEMDILKEEINKLKESE